VKLPVAIDLKPDDEVNRIPPSPRAALPIAIFGTDAFDPTTGLEVSTLRFGSRTAIDGGGGSSPFNSGVEDVNGDGIDDLIVLFRVADTGFDADNTVAVLEGETKGGEIVFGSDTVAVKTPRGKGRR
jgi:hypothetical protein